MVMHILGDWITAHIALSGIIWLIATEIFYCLIIKGEKRHENIWLYSLGGKLMSIICSGFILIAIPALIDLVIWLYNNASYVLTGLGVCGAVFIYLWINKLIAEKLTTEFKSLKLKKGDKLIVVDDNGGDTGLKNGEIVTFVKRQVVDNKKCIVIKSKRFPHGRKNSHGDDNGWYEWRFDKVKNGKAK